METSSQILKAVSICDRTLKQQRASRQPKTLITIHLSPKLLKPRDTASHFGTELKRRGGLLGETVLLIMAPLRLVRSVAVLMEHH